MGDPWEWGWNAIIAISQCIVAIVTFAAVLVALFQNKPRIKINSKHDGKFRIDPVTYKSIEKVGDITITAINVGMLPVEITNIGYKMPHACYTTNENETKKLPKLLMPGERVALNFDLERLKNSKIKNYEIFYATDSCGKAYYHEAKLHLKIRRFLWWNIAKYFGKYGQEYRKNKQNDNVA